MSATLTRHAAPLLLAAAMSTAVAERDSSTSALLQGEALAAIREATIAAGGTITHELPIISAIGARVPRDQLAALRSLDVVERVVDDLDAAGPPEETPACRLSAGLEISLQGTTVGWELFNKGERTLNLHRITVDWPQALGALRGVRVDGRALAQPSLPTDVGPLELRTDDIQLPPQRRVPLRLEFSHAAGARTAQLQNQLNLSAGGGGDCSVELVPSYPAPADDSYFPTVSGASAIHRHGITGAGVTVAVLDSGLWETPPALTHDSSGRPRIRARYDAIDDRLRRRARDESGHGTHMTSIIARSDRVHSPGSDPGTTRYRGIAPDADLVVVKAFDRSGEARLLDLVRGVQWIVDNRERYGIRVVNLSFSMRPRWPYWDDPLNQALMRAWQAGLFLVAAAGNSGPEPMSIGSPGNLPYLLTVGAITDSWTPADRSDDYLPDFSSRGPTPSGHLKPDLVAYGGHITGLIEPGTTLPMELPEYLVASGELVMTGTSQAAAVVSGLAALLLQADPTLSNDQLKCLLTTSAEPAISLDGRLAYSPFQQGRGLVSPQRALALGERECGNVKSNLAQDIARIQHFYGPALFPDTGPPVLPDQDRLVSDITPEHGPSVSRRWGVLEHLRRLEAPPTDSPIDWIAIHASEQAKIRLLAQEN